MSFVHPAFLFLLALPPGLALLHRWFARRRARDLTRFAESGLLARLTPMAALRRDHARRAILGVLGSCALILAILGPQWGSQWREVSLEGASVIFALDTSRSMLANDLAPTRLDRAKLAMAEILPRLRGDRIGLILFAGTSFLQIPPTADYAAFAMALEAARADSIPRGGTAIAPAIRTATQAFARDASAAKILFLISDGENHEGDPVAAANAAAQQGIIICAVGVGSPAGELIPIADENGNTTYLKDSAGQVVKSSLNEQTLRAIAKAGGGGYVRASNLSFGLEELHRQTLAGMKKTRYASKWREQKIDRYQLPLAAAILLLVAEALVGPGGGVRLARRRRGASV